MMMPVWALKAYGRYGGGMAIVAARNEVEAKRTAKAWIVDHWQTRYDNPESIELLPTECDTDTPIVLTHFETGE